MIFLPGYYHVYSLFDSTKVYFFLSHFTIHPIVMAQYFAAVQRDD